MLDPDKAIPFGQHGDIDRLGNSFSLSSGHPHQERGQANEGFGHFGEVLPWQRGYRCHERLVVPVLDLTANVLLKVLVGATDRVRIR